MADNVVHFPVSTWIRSYGIYNDAFFVTFVYGQCANYFLPDGMAEAFYGMLHAAPSKGRWVNQFLRGMPYAKIIDPTADIFVDGRAGDECPTAITQTLNTTANHETDAEGRFANGTNNVWIKFATVAGHPYTVELTSHGDNRYFVQVFEGECDALTEMFSLDANIEGVPASNLLDATTTGFAKISLLSLNSLTGHASVSVTT